MTLFRGEKVLWKPSPSSSSSIFDVPIERFMGHEEGEKEKAPTNERQQACEKNKLTNNNFPECKIEDKKSRKDNTGKVDRGKFFQISLTSNAIRRMVQIAATTSSVYNGDAITKLDGEGIIRSTIPRVFGRLIIRIYNLQWRQHRNENPKIFTASMSDGSKNCMGTILQMKDGELETLSECVVSVVGFVMGMISTDENDDTASCIRTSKNDNRITEENLPKTGSISLEKDEQHSPYIFITRYELLYEKRRGIQDNVENIVVEKRQISHLNDRISSRAEEFYFRDFKYEKRGRLASLISSSRSIIDALITDHRDAIADHQSRYHLETTTEGTNTMLQDDLEVSNFIEQHSTIMALKLKKEKASLLSSSSFSLMPGSLKYFQNYTAAIREFEQTQREEQFTSLSDLEEEYCVDGFVSGEDVVNYRSAGREEQSWMQTTETLENALQCNEDKLSSELLLRWHSWLLGDNLDQEAGSFRSEKVAKRVGEFCDALERHWVTKIKEDPTNPLQITGFAAAVMLGFLDIVPFEVGNQRLAIILLNWTLRQSGIPFCITLYSNREEKQAYISAIQATRQSLCLVPLGYVDESDIALILRSRGGLLPFSSYLLHRLAQATVDLCMLVERKTLMASEETDARLVRLAREKAARGTCIICFEDKPNISTLCCGKPIHLNCLAEWLKSNSSCPQCRADLPPLSVDQGFYKSRDDRRNRYERPVNFNSEEEFITDEFLFHSSSSSSSSESPSSSSSSSSESSAFYYSGLGYGVSDIQSSTSIEDDDDDDDESTSSIRSLLPTRSDTPTPFQSQPHNYITSDEEEQGYDDYNTGEHDDASFSNRTYTSETDDDIDRYSFHTNDSQRSLAPYESNFELARNDDIDIVSDSQTTGSRDTSGGRYDVLIEDSSDDGEELRRDNGSEFVPFRMSFLDPELLGSVQIIRHGIRGNTPNNSGGERDNVLELPEVARPQFLRTTGNVHQNPVGNSNSCDFPPPRGLLSFSRRPRWS